MLAVLLVATAGLFGAMAFVDMGGDGSDSEDDQDESVEDPSLQPDVLDPPDDVADLPIDDFDGTDGNDTVTLDISSPDPEGQATYYGPEAGLTYEGADLTRISTGDGDDLITVVNGDAEIDTGRGDDTVDARGMRDGVIVAEGNDVVLGTDVVQGDTAGDFGVLARDGATFQGGLGHELAVAEGDGSTLSGGGGNDVLMSDTGSAEMSGGDGDDRLISNADDLRFSQASNSFTIENYVDGSVDILDGGAGDDYLEMANGDFGTGGEGGDRFVMYFDASSSLEAGTVTDFTPGEDQLAIKMGGGEPGLPDDPSYDLTDRVDVIEADGNSYITVDGDITTNIPGVIGLTIGVPDPDGAPGSFMDFESGEPAEREEFDVLVSVYAVR